MPLELPPDQSAKLAEALGPDFKPRFVVRKEDGGWKVDLNETGRRIEAAAAKAAQAKYGDLFRSLGKNGTNPPASAPSGFGPARAMPPGQRWN